MTSKSYDSLSNSILGELKSVKKEIQSNRLKRANGAKSSYRVTKLNVPCHGVFSNAVMNDVTGDIELEVRGYQDSIKPFTRKHRYNVNSQSIRYYDDICNTLGTSGEPSELIGKYIEFHLEENKGFENLRVDREESEDEFVDYLTRIEEGSVYDTWDGENTGQKTHTVHRHKRLSGTTASETGTPKKKKRKAKPVTENVDDIADDLSDFD